MARDFIDYARWLVSFLESGLRITIDLRTAHPLPTSTPPRPKVLNVTFTRGDSLMAALKGNPQLSPADPAFSVTSRQTVVLINGVTSVTLDMIDPAATFDCVDGDTILVVNTDINAVGSSPTSDPFTVVASTGPSVPPKPTVLGVVFTVAP